MTEQQLLKAAIDYTETSPSNRVGQEKALRPEFSGMKILDAPIMGVASANDDYLLSLPDIPEARINQAAPTFFLESAKSVISLYFPFAERIRESNRRGSEPSDEILHTRNEGIDFIDELCVYLKDLLEKAGYKTVVPDLDSRFWMTLKKPVNDYPFTSNWSHRHVAYACGLGTFGLHGGIVTRLGTAGCFGSLITELELPPTQRPYKELQEYCDRCGVCLENCPADAITLEGGKDHLLCLRFAAQVAKKYAEKEYIGTCGKCQTAVPCESGIPGR